MAMSIGTITVDLRFRIPLWQAIKLRIAGKGLAQRLVDDFIMKRLKELEAGDAISSMERRMSPDSIRRSDEIFTKLKDS